MFIGSYLVAAFGTLVQPMPINDAAALLDAVGCDPEMGIIHVSTLNPELGIPVCADVIIPEPVACEGWDVQVMPVDSWDDAESVGYSLAREGYRYDAVAVARVQAAAAAGTLRWTLCGVTIEGREIR